MALITLMNQVIASINISEYYIYIYEAYGLVIKAIIVYHRFIFRVFIGF